MTEERERKAFYQVVHSRRSVRRFKPDPVPREALERILEVGHRAASAANRQPWHFVVAEKSPSSLLHRLLEGRSMVEAPVLIMGLADRRPAWVRKGDGINYAWVDTTIALTEMILAATAEGFGTCWVAAFDPAEARRLLKLPPEVDPVALIALGHAEEPLAPHEKDRRPVESVIGWGGYKP
jgi:nitroreductase